MTDYTIKRLEEVQDVLGDYPGEMRMMTRDLEAEQVAFSYRRMPSTPEERARTGAGTRSRRRSTSWLPEGSSSS